MSPRKAFCKKDFIYGDVKIFVKGNTYTIAKGWSPRVVPAETVHIINPNYGGERFIFNLDNGYLNNYFYEYFYSDIELRKLKLEKLNGN